MNSHRAFVIYGTTDAGARGDERPLVDCIEFANSLAHIPDPGDEGSNS